MEGEKRERWKKTDRERERESVREKKQKQNERENVRKKQKKNKRERKREREGVKQVHTLERRSAVVVMGENTEEIIMGGSDTDILTSLSNGVLAMILKWECNV